MRLILSVVSFSAVAIGAAAGFYLFPDVAETSLAEVASVDDQGRARLAPPAAPETPQSAHSATTAPRFFGTAIPAPAQPATSEHADAAAPARQQSAPWHTSVTPPAPTLVVRSDAVRTTQAITTGSLPRREPSPDTTIRDIQRELRRVGCYHGEIDGAWGPGSQRALAAFLERVNSALPTTAPDLVQLTLLRGYTGSGCSTPRGVMTAGTVRTTPVEPTRTSPIPPAPQLAVRTLPLQAAPSVVPPVAVAPPVPVAVVPTSQQAPPVVIFEGRMAVGGPRSAEPPGASNPSPLTASDSTAAPRRVVRTSPPPRTTQTRRRERSWTATFFNQ